MPTGLHRLSPKRVQSVKDHGRHADGGGLYLVVDQYGKRWVFMWTRDGRRSEMGLGPLRDVGLVEAPILSRCGQTYGRRPSSRPSRVHVRTRPNEKRGDAGF